MLKISAMLRIRVQLVFSALFYKTVDFDMKTDKIIRNAQFAIKGRFTPIISVSVQCKNS